MEKIIYDDYNGKVRDDQDTCGTLTTNCGNNAPRNGFKIIEMENPIIGALRGRNPENPSERGRSNGQYKQRLELNENHTSNTITSVQKDNVVVEPVVLGWTRDSKGNVVDRHPAEVANCVTAAKRDNTQNYVVVPSNTKEGEWKSIIGNKQQNPFRGSTEDIAPCITSASGMGGGMTPMVTNASVDITKTDDFIEQLRGHNPKQYRIRKLTERECMRLMGVRDEDSDKIRAAVSKSQCYKLAGNSIVVDVMVGIFEQLLIGNKNTNQQLELF